MKLTAEEQAWLDGYRRALAERFPGLVEEIVVFGSKAREEAGPESDLDVLVVLREGDSGTKRDVREMGHRLAVASDAVPSILVYTREEWSARQQKGSPLSRAILRDGVRVT